jgi:hypothetical protein
VRRGVATISYPLRGTVYTHYLGARDASLERYARADTTLYSAQLANNSMYHEACAVQAESAR